MTTKTDTAARAFIDGGAGKARVSLGVLPPVIAKKTGASESNSPLWLTQSGAQMLAEFEKRVTFQKAGDCLASDIAKAEWREQGGKVVADTDYFSFTFARDERHGRALENAAMRWAAKVSIADYLAALDLLRHSDERRKLPDFFLRDLSAAEIKDHNLQPGAALSVLSTRIKKLARYAVFAVKIPEREFGEFLEKHIGDESLLDAKASAQKNALVIVGKRGEGRN